MPIDPSIPLAVRPAQIQSPFEAMQAVAQFQALREQTEARRLAADEARQKAKDAAAIRQVFAETGGDIEQALPRLRMIAPTAALAFETELHKGRKEKFDALEAEYALRGTRLDLGLRIGQSVTDDRSYQVALPTILALDPDLKPLLPETYDPVRWQAIMQMGLTAKDVLAQKQEGLKLFAEGKVAEALGTTLSVARTAEEWDATLQGALALGAPKAIVEQFGAYSPENVARAGQLAMTPEKRATLAGQAESRAQTAAHQAVIEGQGAQRVAIAQQRAAQGPTSGEPLVAIIGPDGNPVLVPRSQAAGQRPAGGAGGTGEATHQQSLAGGFAERLGQAEPIIGGPVGTTIRNMSLPAFKLQTESWFAQPSFQSNEVQQYMQASRNFINAVLRRESGAVISEEEFANAKAQYLPLPGDTPATTAQKKANRDLVFDSMRREAGSAYQAPSGAPGAPGGGPPPRPPGANPFRAKK